MARHVAAAGRKTRVLGYTRHTGKGGVTYLPSAIATARLPAAGTRIRQKRSPEPFMACGEPPAFLGLLRNTIRLGLQSPQSNVLAVPRPKEKGRAYAHSPFLRTAGYSAASFIFSSSGLTGPGGNAA